MHIRSVCCVRIKTDEYILLRCILLQVWIKCAIFGGRVISLIVELDFVREWVEVVVTPSENNDK